jgi:organic radical activating enzyme
MSTPLNQPPPEQPGGEPMYAQDLIELRDRMAADGVRIRIPRLDSKWELPEPIEVEGETASEILIRWRHAPP